MNTNTPSQMLWMLDSSTFIHCLCIDRLRLLLHLRSPVFFPEYVLRYELGANARECTRLAAEEWTQNGKIGIMNLTIRDLEDLVSLGAPRRIGIGELACAIVARREGGGILCDDRHAQIWILDRMHTLTWESVEDFLLAAAAGYHLSELDLRDDQITLRKNKYECRFDDLQLEFLYRRANK